MKRGFTPALVAIALVTASCADTGTAPPATTTAAAAPQNAANRYLIDPRIGFTQPPQPAIDRRFDAAWRAFVAGNLPDAQKRVADVRARYPQYVPAALAEAAIDIQRGDLTAAHAIVQRVESQAPDYTAARVYDAEIAIAENRTRDAYDIYHSLAQRPDAPPTVAERTAMLQDRLFDELFTSAQTTPDPEAIRLLNEALTLNAGSLNARVMLAGKYIAARDFDAARQTLEPVVSSADADKPEVQAELAEIEVGRGQFEQAINRYERLARRDPHYASRLEDIKQQWTAANMPPQYQRAYETEAINRADLAVLMYWKLTSVRFAQNLGAPPIAIDLEEIPGREEIIRAIALGIYDVDPVTRRVSPLRAVNAATLERIAARLLTNRRASCAAGLPYERDETQRAQKILAACGIDDPAATVPPDSPVSGKTAATLLDEIERVLPH